MLGSWIWAGMGLRSLLAGSCSEKLVEFYWPRIVALAQAMLEYLPLKGKRLYHLWTEFLKSPKLRMRVSAARTV
jgi:hypothetical protein